MLTQLTIGAAGFLIGALVASVVWFFVWRNNKRDFAGYAAWADTKFKHYEDKIHELGGSVFK